MLTTMLVCAAGFHANAVINHGQRIAVLESELHNVSRKMDSIEAKLDRLLLK